MHLNGSSCSGQQRFQLLSTHLQSCFISSDILFSQIVDELKVQDSDVYRSKYSNEYEYLWHEYTNWFTADKITSAIQKLNDKKDSGPMQITVKFIK